MTTGETIVAVATGPGGALAVIRISGESAIALCEKVFRSASGKKLSGQPGYTLHYGTIADPDSGEVADDVLLSLFRAPRSYTGEDMAEISCHGSSYIQQEIVRLLIRHGARHAQAGEFTVRAFLNGKIDLSQAEAVADMIASTDRATHALATNQMRGGYSTEFGGLRDELLHLASLMELELDFSEEDVTFADRTQLDALLEKTAGHVERLRSSFTLGNAVKSGIGVAIIGSPNAGKSTLLNALVKEDRAMVSDIAGTTRDVIEEAVNIGGVHFRFIDTAGIRSTDDTLEKMGIERTYASIGKARIVLLVVDAVNTLSGDDTTSSPQESPGIGITPENGIIQESPATGTAPQNSTPLQNIAPEQSRQMTQIRTGDPDAPNGQDIPPQTAIQALLSGIRDTLERITLTEDQSLCILLNKVDKTETREQGNISGFHSPDSPPLPATGPNALTPENGNTPDATPVAGNDGPGSLAAMVSASTGYPAIALSAKNGDNLDAVTRFLSESVATDPLYDGTTIVSNSRHYEALQRASESLNRAREGLRENIATDLLAQDIREVLHHIGTITGEEITSQSILESIFSKFCIGK